MYIKIVYISETRDGSVDIDDLETKLKLYSSLEGNKNRTLIGCFAAASNITGILSDVNRISITLHKYNALAFWDYASAAPYVNIDMNPFVQGEENGELAYKDAIYFSPHKFIGGPQTPVKN
jgi:selenocysteine lyase/cysteine desulfurase